MSTASGLIKNHEHRYECLSACVWACVNMPVGVAECVCVCGFCVCVCVEYTGVNVVDFPGCVL